MARRPDTWVCTVQATGSKELLYLFGPWQHRDSAERRAVQLAMGLSQRGDLADYHIDIRRVSPVDRMDSHRIPPLTTRRSGP